MLLLFSVKIFSKIFYPADDADLRRGFFKPQITQMTLIFNKLQFLQISQIEFFDAPFDTVTPLKKGVREQSA